MRFLFLILALFAFAEAAQANCTTIDVTSSTDELIQNRSGIRLTAGFNPDVSGTETVAAVEVEWCMDDTNTTSETCFDWSWDSDGDGVDDTNILDGSAGKDGIVIDANVPFVRFVTSTNPSGTDEPQLSLCRP